MRHRRHLSSPRAIVATLAATTLLLAGCSGGDDDPAAERLRVLRADQLGDDRGAAGADVLAPDRPRAQGRRTPAPRHRHQGRQHVLQRPAGGSRLGRPGRRGARRGRHDTRLAAFYYSKVPAAIGPVRSMRASDIGIVPDGRRPSSPAAPPRSRSTGSTAPASRGSPRAPPASTARRRARRRTTSSPSLGDISKRLKAEEEPPALPPVRRRGRPAQGRRRPAR